MEQFNEFWRQWIFTGLGAIVSGLCVYLWGKFKKGADLCSEYNKEEFLKDTNKKIEDIYNTLAQITDTIDALREGVLSSHFNALRKESIRYIERGYIYPDELQLYEEELGTYVRLGGNGHMDGWKAKVMTLPNQKIE